MKNGILTIFKKELARFFGDRRMVFSAVILPGLMIYLLYSIMGGVINEQNSTDELPTVAVVGLPTGLEECLRTEYMPYELEDTETASLEHYENTLANKFDVGSTDRASSEDATRSFFAMMLPMLLMTFLYSGCATIAPDSIAGEKERGTIATLLITPVGRTKIALGKIAALSIIALISGGSSAMGAILSMPKLIGTELSENVYSANDYGELGIVILSTVLLLVTFISILSAYAKSVKEAQMMALPLQLAAMLCGVMAMSGDIARESAVYFIPIYNTVQCMVGIFSGASIGSAILITALSNVVYTIFGVWLLTKLFRSERIVFSS